MERALLAFCLVLVLAVALTPCRVMGGKIVDVANVGAVAGDGKDDAGAIDAAIRAAGDGDTVQIGAGTWEIASAIQARSHVSIVGVGCNLTTIRFIGKSPSAMLQIKGVSDVVVSKMTLDGDNLVQAAQGIEAENASKLKLSDLRVVNLGAASGFGPHGIYFAANVSESVIANCEMANIGTGSEWGAGIRISHGSSNNNIIGNTIEKTGRGGILADNDSTDLVIRSNRVSGSGQSGGPKTHGLGIELWRGCHRSVVEDNRIDHWLSVDSSNQVAVRRNVIFDMTGAHQWAGLELVNAQDDAFTDNTVDRGAKVGISISGDGPKQRVYWGYNTIRRASTWGAQVQGEAGKASRMYFYKNTFTGTARSTPNTLFAPQGHGVRFNGNAQNIVLDSNTIIANQGAGVQLAGSNLADLVFQRNAITNNSQDAVVGDVSGAMWIDNALTGNGRNTVLPALVPQVKPPTASVRCSGRAVVGEPISFWLEPAGGVGEIVAVLWDADDGIPATTATIKHVYATPGKYRVTAVGWDTSGRGVMGEMMLDVQAKR